MKVMVIGGTGHVGKLMVPHLIDAGCDVVAVGSGRTAPPTGGAWDKTKFVACKVGDGDWAERLRSESPDVVVEMPGQAKIVYDAFKGHTGHIIACGSLWMYGLPRIVPTPEQTQNECLFESYAARYAQLQEMVAASGEDGTAFTAIMPPNICGPGKIPIDGLGGRDAEVHAQHAVGQEVILPEGCECLISPCDVSDIGMLFTLAAMNRDAAQGQFFNVGSAYALTASEFIKTYGRIYGVDIPVRHVSWQKYIDSISPGMGWWWHFKAHMCPDISKAKRMLGYEPEFTPEQTMARAVQWMKQNNVV